MLGVINASLDLELFAISKNQKKLYFNNCKVDCVMSLIALHLNLRFLKMHLSVLIQFLELFISPPIPKTLYANFSNIVGKGIIFNIGYVHFSCYTLISHISNAISCAFKIGMLITPYVLLKTSKSSRIFLLLKNPIS